MGSNATFTATVFGTGPFSYQWRFNGEAIPGATTNIHTITNVQPVHGGDYIVVVSDNYGATTSQVARLTVLVRPFIVEHPQSQTVLAGETVTLSVTVTNTATLPITYRWRRTSPNFSNLATNILNEYVSTFTLTNVQTNLTGSSYSVGITNLAGAVPLSSNAVLTVLAP